MTHHTIHIDLPEHFNFKSTVYSHGWSSLPPFELDIDKWQLRYIFSTAAGPVPAVISEEDGRLGIEIEGPELSLRGDFAKPTRSLKKANIRDPIAQSIVDQTRHILRLDDDLTDFYNLIKKADRLSWVRERNAGRLLRSPTVFEDLVKTICTTNCSWGLTKIMVANLVEKLGETPASSPQSVGNANSFPTAEAMASVDADFYRREIKAGYRSPYFVELAESVASARLDPELWLTSDLPTGELKKEMKKVKGVGDYAAENLLKLVGRYDGLALDSWLRAQFFKNHNGQKPCPDKKIERHYAKYGEWRGLVMWCDMTEKWIA
jgi:3-methyladenine DNA glycosylase/8-oxoguanine DNA glycosylase